MSFFKKHQKKLLALFSVGLMITFAVSSGQYNPNSNNPVVAHAAGEIIRAEERSNSQHLWSILRRTEIAHLPGAREDQTLPATVILGVGQQLIEQDPDTFLLLQKEAAHMGLTASVDGVKELMQNQITLNENSSPEEVEATKQAFAALLLVNAGYQRASSVLKTTGPERQFYMATLGQAITLKYLSYDANEFKAAIPAPTPDQLKQQFDKYKATLADEPDEKTNPFGFGYKYPDRVMLDVMTIARADLKEAVTKSKDPATWEVEARKQYLRNPSYYPTSRPFDPTTKPSTQPTTRPLGFADYHQQIIDRLIDEAEEKLVDEVQKKLATTMSADWAAYRAAVKPTTRPTTQPAAGPTTALGVSYDSPEYFPKLALAIQKEFKLLPQTNRYAKNLMAAKDLSLLPMVGSAELVSDDYQSRSLTLSEYVMNFLDSFGHQASSRDAAPTLSILSPSPALTDLSRNVHLFRVIAADAAHPATDMSPFAAKIEADFKLAAAVTKAREQVDKLVTVAKATNLDAAATSVGRKVFTTGKILGRGTPPMPDLPLKPGSELTLRRAAFDLLKRGDEIKAGKAVSVVELPLEGKVLLVAPAEITPLWAADNLFRVEGSISRELTQQNEQAFRLRWYDPKEVQKRTGYQSEEKKKDPLAG